MARVLVIKLGALGDVVQADGAVRDIRGHHAGDSLTVMTTPAYQPFMERCPWVDEVFVDPRSPRFNLRQMALLRRRLQRAGFDMVYDLQQVGRTRFYCRWLFPKTAWLGDVRGCTYYLKRPDLSCAADHFARHLEMAGVAVEHTLEHDVSWMADRVDGILAAHDLRPGYVVLIPGASSAHADKRWPRFAELARRLLAGGRRVVTIPGPAELDLCRTIPGDMLVTENGYHDIFTLAGLVKQAAYVVGNDTGPTHIAAHCRCRGLALYGGHTPALYTGIQHTRFRWLEKPRLEDLSFDSVWDHVRTALAYP